MKKKLKQLLEPKLKPGKKVSLVLVGDRIKPYVVKSATNTLLFQPGDEVTDLKIQELLDICPNVAINLVGEE